MGFEDNKQAIKAYLIQEKLTYAKVLGEASREYKVTYAKVLEEASREYKNLVDSNAWKSALHAPDVKIPPSGFGANLAAGCQPVGGGPLSAEALALIKTMNSLVPNGGGSGDAAGCDGSSKPGLVWQRRALETELQEPSPLLTGPCCSCAWPWQLTVDA